MEQPTIETKQVYIKSNKWELLLIIPKSRNSTSGHIWHFIYCTLRLFDSQSLIVCWISGCPYFRRARICHSVFIISGFSHKLKVANTPLLYRLCSDVVMTPIFSTNQSQCASISKNVATLFLSFKWVTTARNLLIDSHHYRETSQKNNIPTVFHSLSFRNLHSFHSNATKT